MAAHDDLFNLICDADGHLDAASKPRFDRLVAELDSLRALTAKLLRTARERGHDDPDKAWGEATQAMTEAGLLDDEGGPTKAERRTAHAD